MAKHEGSEQGAKHPSLFLSSYKRTSGSERVAEDFLPFMLDDHVQDFHWCMKIVKRDCSKISTSSLQSESFAFPRDAWFFIKASRFSCRLFLIS